MSNFTGTVPTFVADEMLTSTDMSTISSQLTAHADAWTSYTPTLTNMTLGNGTMTAKYKQIGKTVYCSGKITMGSTSSVTGAIGVSVPVNAKDTNGIGSALFYDSSTTANRSGGECDFSAVGRLEFFGGNGGGPATATLPFTWATSDQLRWVITYEAA